MAYMTWPWSKAAKVVASWQKWGPAQADEIWSACHLDARPGDTPSVSVAAFSLGSYGELQNALDKLADQAGGPGPPSVRLTPTGYLGRDGVLRGLLLQVHRAVPYAGFAARAGPARASWAARPTPPARTSSTARCPRPASAP